MAWQTPCRAAITLELDWRHEGSRNEEGGQGPHSQPAMPAWARCPSCEFTVAPRLHDKSSAICQPITGRISWPMGNPPDFRLSYAHIFSAAPTHKTANAAPCRWRTSLFILLRAQHGEGGSCEATDGWGPWFSEESPHPSRAEGRARHLPQPRKRGRRRMKRYVNQRADFRGDLEVEFSRYFERGDSDEEEQIYGHADHVCVEAGGGWHACG